MKEPSYYPGIGWCIPDGDGTPKPVEPEPADPRAIAPNPLFWGYARHPRVEAPPPRRLAPRIRAFKPRHYAVRRRC